MELNGIMREILGASGNDYETLKMLMESLAEGVGSSFSAETVFAAACRLKEAGLIGIYLYDVSSRVFVPVHEPGFADAEKYYFLSTDHGKRAVQE